MLARQLKEQGILINLMALGMLLPLIVTLVDGDPEMVKAMALSVLITAFSGAGLMVAFRDGPEAESRRGLFVLPAFIILFLPIFGALPFLLSGAYPNFAFAYFESVSGFTSTGASMIADPGSLPRALLLWRGLLEWTGGGLTILIALTILSTLNVGAMKLMTFRIPHGGNESIIGQMNVVAQALAPVYVGITLLTCLGLMISGEAALDALTISLSVSATGGFTIYSGGQVLQANPVGELWVAIFLMIGATNILVLWNWTRLRHDKNGQDRETLYLWLFALIGALLLLAMFSSSGAYLGGELPERIRVALFSAASSLSTSGFAPDGSSYVGQGASAIMIVLLLIGGMAASTSSGFKIMRVILQFRHAGRELKLLAHRHDASLICYGGRRAEREDIASVWLLFFSSILIVSLAILGFAALGYNLGDAMGLAVAGFANAGPAAYSLVSDFTGYEFMSWPGLSLFFVLMVLGRLEAVFALAVLSRHFWRV